MDRSDRNDAPSEIRKTVSETSDRISRHTVRAAEKAKAISGDAVAYARDVTRSASENAINISKKAAEKAVVHAERGIRMTRSLKFHLAAFAGRFLLFATALFFYLTRRELLQAFMDEPFFRALTPLTFVWAIFMGIMISHLVPNNHLTMAWRKARESEYVPAGHHERLDLLEYVQQQNVGAWRVMLAWLFFNAIFGVLYLLGVIESVDLLMLTVFYYLSDRVCILFWCPFQHFIMKNKCCVNCRIYDWGHFMMFTPMLFIKTFFSWSLFFTSLVVLIHWELVYARHPERFWEGSNCTIRCANCKEESCQIKKRVRVAWSKGHRSPATAQRTEELH